MTAIFGVLRDWILDAPECRYPVLSAAGWLLLLWAAGRRLWGQN